VALARPNQPEPWTVEEFLAWEREQEERYEYVGGVIRMMVGGTLDHNTIAGNVFSGLRTQLRDGPCRVFMEAVKVVADAATMYPDVVVTCAPGSGQSDVVPEPEIVVEVLSRSTQSFDRGPKLDAYQQILSLKQYVLIAQDEIRVSVYERDDGSWRYRILQDLDARLGFAVGGANVTLAEIYERATIAERTTSQSG
jgi:Uma2 family endonuclease